jgi:hypothetical protein
VSGTQLSDVQVLQTAGTQSVGGTTDMATQVPAWQESPEVQACPSSQVAPSGLAGLLQTPLAALQVPAVWHESEAVQALGAPPVQAPATQDSPVVQALPSEQVVPLATGGFEQRPVVASQVPAAWH